MTSVRVPNFTIGRRFALEKSMLEAMMRRKIGRRTLLAGVGAGALAGSCGGARAPQAVTPARRQEGAGAPSTIPQRPLGKTGVMVSMLGLGGHHIGRPKDEQESIRLVRMAIDNGITFLDNCWDYNEGRSEERMGKALTDGYRQRAFLMTKLDGRTRGAASQQLEQSLTRLRTDVIDLVQIHEVIREEDIPRSFAEGGALDALLEGRKAGKLRFIGFTGHKDPALHRAMLEAGFKRGFTFDAVQMPLNAMDPHYRSFEKEVLPVLIEHGIGVLGMKAMGDGILLKSKAVSAPECLQYALSLPTSVVITGCESVEILKQAIDVGTHFQPLTSEQKEALLARTLPAGKAGEYELFKTSARFDGTTKNPHWLESAVL
jgi:predicted aldo/keto reductase-like oxidoreductase